MNNNNILEDAMRELNFKEEEEEILEPDEELEEEEEEEEEEIVDETVEPEKPVASVVTPPVVEVPPVVKKPTAAEKEEFAFEKLRKKARESEETLKQLDDIAHQYGFTNNAEMIEKLRQDASNKKAKEMGVDPKFYEDLQTTKRELETIKREREDEIARNKINVFVSRVDEFAKENSLTEDEKSELINVLDEDGFTIDTLSNIKNYKKLFSGYIKDTLVAKEQQKALEKETKRKNLQEPKLTDTKPINDKFDLNKVLDILIKQGGTKY